MSGWFGSASQLEVQVPKDTDIMFKKTSNRETDDQLKEQFPSYVMHTR